VSAGITFFAVAMSFAGRLMELNDHLLLRINSLAGRSWLFDNLVAFFQDNDLAKAGVVGCCFLAAWYGSSTAETTRQTRKILIVTLVAAVCVIVTTKSISHTVFLPRPAIEAHKIYHYEGDQLVLMKRVPVRVPLDEGSQKDYRDLLSGDVQTNDLGSFPSDHAGFFIAISLGIWLAKRRLGWVALGWTVLVILGGKMITGHHTPLDIAAGAAVGAAEVMALQFATRTRLGSLVDGLTGLTLRYRAMSSAIVFVLAFEMTSTLIHVRAFLGLLSAVRRHVLLGMG
jgi:membrane-associated phospholipid phosphatase